MSEPTPETSLTRRRFAAGAATAAAAILLPGKPAQPETEPPLQSQPGALDKLSPGARAEVEARVKEIVRKYGSRLSDAQKADIRKVIVEGQEGLEKMRRYVLDNGDQPATVFQFYDRAMPAVSHPVHLKGHGDAK